MQEAQILSSPEGSEESQEKKERDIDVVGVRIGGRGGIVDCQTAVGCRLQDVVIVRFPEGLRTGRVLREKRTIPAPEKQMPRVIRVAGQDDLDRIRSQAVTAHELLLEAKRLARELNLDMSLGGAEQYFDGSRIVFYFAAEERVDFRELLRRLHKVAHRRVELRQEGLRDIAGRAGGIGTCGQELCCSRWLIAFDPVSIRSAKTQCLSITSDKITGQCGRLKCCLNYENSLYKQLRADMPEPGKWVRTEKGYAKVREINIFKREVTVIPLDRSDGYMVTVHRREIVEIYKKPPDELLQLLNARGSQGKQKDQAKQPDGKGRATQNNRRENSANGQNNGGNRRRKRRKNKKKNSGPQKQG